MNEHNKILISFLAPTKYGKTTAVQIVNKYYKSANVRLSEPLYELQNMFYRYLGVEEEGLRDGELLQFLGDKIQKDFPEFLAAKFSASVLMLLGNFEIDIITNDDCRPYNYPCLKEMGFRFIKIDGYPHKRDDYRDFNANSTNEWQKNNIPYDYMLYNKQNNMHAYEMEIINLINKIMSEN